MVEFTLAGIAGVTILISTIQLGLAMWNYHSLAEAVHETNRYAASHGRTCMANHCTITVGDIVTKFQNQAVGLPADSVNMTLSSETGVVVPCNPISSCSGSSTMWPPSDHFDNAPGRYITMTATLNVRSAMVLVWAGVSGQRISAIGLPSKSSMPIVF